MLVAIVKGNDRYSIFKLFGIKNVPVAEVNRSRLVNDIPFYVFFFLWVALNSSEEFLFFLQLSSGSAVGNGINTVLHGKIVTFS